MKPYYMSHNYMKYFIICLSSNVMLVPFPALCQDTPVDLGKIDIIEKAPEVTKRSAPAYESYDPVDSGMSVINQKSVEGSKPGGSDTSELLKTLPFVQMDVKRSTASQESIQSIRPSDFSISGGNFYDNSIMIEGVGANSMMDITEDNPAHFNEVAGATPQTLYVDPSLVDSVEIYDSNIAAEYGGFTGGVVDYKLRKPKDRFSVNFTSGYQNDSMQEYKTRLRDKIDAQDNPPPSFRKYNSALTLDLPLTDKLAVLASYSRSDATVDYELSEDYGGDKFTNSDLSENFLLKGIYTLSDTISAEAQVIYSPYTSGFRDPRGINNQVDSASDGLAAYFQLDGLNGELDWQAKFSYSISDTGRKASPYYYYWDSDAEYVDWCNLSDCAEGGFGDLAQKQTEYIATFKGTQPQWSGDLSFGLELRSVKANKARSQDGSAYSKGITRVENGWDNLTCPQGDSACIENDIILTKALRYAAYDAKAAVNSQSLWLEYQRQLGPVNLRGGLRYEHEDFLNNHNISPRFTVAWEFLKDTYLTIGANRYYANNTLSYAIKEQIPGIEIYERKLDDNGKVIIDSTTNEHGWYPTHPSLGRQYSTSNLNTPYSNELTAALTLSTPLNGNFRLKGVLRNNRDSFVTQADKADDGVYSNYHLTNEGKTDYRGLSLEWSGHYNNHRFNANVTWSKTKTLNGIIDYGDTFDPDERNSILVYYEGHLVSLSEIDKISERQNYAAPLRASISWSADWLDNRLLTYAAVQYRGQYDTLANTEEKIDIDGNKYDIYDKITRKAFTSVDLNLSYKLISTKKHQASVDLRISNLLNDFPYTDTNPTDPDPYQLGRSYWLYLTYTY